MRNSWVWTAILLATVFAVLLVIFVFPGSVLRPYILFWFLLLCPGMALVRVFGLSSQLAVVVTLATGFSIALDALFAALLLYAGVWSPSLILMLLVWFTLACVLVQLLLTIVREGDLKSLNDVEKMLYSMLPVHHR